MEVAFLTEVGVDFYGLEMASLPKGLVLDLDVEEERAPAKPLPSPGLRLYCHDRVCVYISID